MSSFNKPIKDQIQKSLPTQTPKDMENSLNDSFKITLFDDSLKEISQEYLELGIDSLIDNELVKSIPVVKTISGFYKFTKSIQGILLD